MSRPYYDPRKLRRSMSKPPSDPEHDHREDRGRDDRRQYDSRRPYTSRSRSPARSDVDKHKSHQSRRGEDTPQSKDQVPPPDKRSREKNPPKHTDLHDKHKTMEKQSGKGDAAIIPAKRKHLDLSYTKPVPVDPEAKARLATLKQQFPDHYFEHLQFVPALEPLSSKWADNARASIDAVEKQYTEMYRYSRNLSKIIRDLITDIDQMKKVADLDENTLKKLEKDLDDTQAQLVIAQRDASSFKKQFEELQKRYHDALESHSQDRLDLKKQAEEAKLKSVEAESARSILEQEKAELARKNAELEKRNAELEAKLVEAENRAALAEGNLDSAIKSNEDIHKQLSEANKELRSFGELTIEFFAHVIRRRNISWIEDYPTTLVHVWNQIIEWEKDELKVDSIDEDKLMEQYLRDDEPARLVEGRRLIAAAMEDEKLRAKGKNVIDAGSSSIASEATRIEPYDPENPGIPKAPVLSPILESVSDASAIPIDKSSEGISVFSPQFVKAIYAFRNIIGQSTEIPLTSPELITVASRSLGIEPTAKATGQQDATASEKPSEEVQEKREEVTPAEPEVEARGKEEDATNKAPVPPITETPHDEDMIPALKGDSDDGGHEEDDEVLITGESEKDDNMTLASMKAKQEKLLKIKTETEEADPEGLKPITMIDPKTKVIVKVGGRSITGEIAKKTPSDPVSPTSSKKKPKRVLTDAEKEARDILKAAKKSKPVPKSK